MNALLDKIRETLSKPNGRVVVSTYTKQTVYGPKHLPMFSANEREQGVYVQRGKRRDYVFPQYVFFGEVR